MNAKQSLEKLLTAERKTTKELKAKIEDLKENGGVEVPSDVKELHAKIKE